MHIIYIYLFLNYINYMLIVNIDIINKIFIIGLTMFLKTTIN